MVYPFDLGISAIPRRVNIAAGGEYSLHENKGNRIILVSDRYKESLLSWFYYTQAYFRRKCLYSSFPPCPLFGILSQIQRGSERGRSTPKNDTLDTLVALVIYTLGSTEATDIKSTANADL